MDWLIDAGLFDPTAASTNLCAPIALHFGGGIDQQEGFGGHVGFHNSDSGDT